MKQQEACRQHTRPWDELAVHACGNLHTQPCCVLILKLRDAPAPCERQRSLHSQPCWRRSSMRLLHLGLGAQSWAAFS